MTTINTSYKIRAGVTTDAERLTLNIEEGAMLTTESGLWQVYNNAWRKLYPQAGEGTGLGWARYDDGQYTSSNKLSLADGVTINIPNNAANIVRSNVGFDYYNEATQRVTADNTNDTYIMTVVFNCSAVNANQTILNLNFKGTNGTPYDRIKGEFIFSKGNDIEHSYHQMFQYYADSTFVSNGSYWEILSLGGIVEMWDIIYFIQKTQNYA
jgi:hypothetical protein